MSTTTKLSKVLRQFNRGGWLCLHWRCHGCKVTHQVWVERPPEHAGPTWTWNRDADAPVFGPSVRTWWDEGEESARVSHNCHVYVGGAAGERPGWIQYLDDCTHDVRGWHPMLEFVHAEDLPPLPKQEPPRLRKPQWRPA